jgi:hypothetical protein
MKVSSTIGGLAGSAALTLLNQTAKKVTPDAPRLDLLGQNALAKFVKGNDMLSKTTREVFPLAGDLISNSLFFAMARGKGPTSTLVRGAFLGLGAGVAAVALPKPMGLEQENTNRNPQTQALTVAWYVLGGIIAGAVINALDSYKDDKPAKKTEKPVKNIARIVEKGREFVADKLK